MAGVAFFVDDKKTLAAAARACRVLGEAALDALWSDLDSVMPLVKLLGDLVVKSNLIQPTNQHRNYYGNSSYSYIYEWEFANPCITRKNWTTYGKYSVRVKKITLSLDRSFRSNGDEYPLSSKIFSSISLTQSRATPLLPNIRHITLVPSFGTIAHCLPFLDQSSKDVNLVLKIADDHALFQFILQELCVRLPHLTVVRIETSVGITRLEDDLVAFLDDLEDLQCISLPRFYLTTRALVSLSKLKPLEEISTNSEYAESHTQNIPPLQTLSDNHFRNLKKLAIASTLEPLIPLFGNPLWAPLLTELEVSSPDSNSPSLRDFGAAIAKHRPGLLSLHIDLFGSNPANQAIEFRHFIPLLGCNKLINFGLRHRLSCQLNRDQLEEMLRHWPELKEIRICVDPDVTQNLTPRFSFDILNLFAEICPNIEKVGLLFDGAGTLSWSVNLRLPKLQELHVGWVKPANASEIGLYLASICDNDLKFVCGGWEDSPRIHTPNPGPTPVAEWEKVNRRFKLLVRIKQRRDAETRPSEPTPVLGWRVISSSNSTA